MSRAHLPRPRRRRNQDRPAARGRDGTPARQRGGPGCNPNRLGDDALARSFRQCAALVACQRPQGLSDLAVVLAGVAGASHPRNNARVHAALSAAVPGAGLVRVVSDTVPALWSGTRGAAGIALIAGTGACAYGEDGRGGGHRAGGWGYLIGDDGSGCALGREAVRAVCRSFDGCGERTTLWDKIAAAHGLSAPIDLVPFDRLVPLLLEAWREADACARLAVERVVSDQAALVAAVHRSLSFGGAPFTLVPRGGLLDPDAGMRPLLLRLLGRRLPEARYCVDESEAPPVFGSTLLALRAGSVLTERAADTLLGQMRRAGLCARQSPSP